jgi:hypothetical protein
MLLLLFMSMEWEHISDLRLPTGLLFILREIYECNHDGIILTEGNQRTRRKTYPSATLSTAKPTWTDLDAIPSLHGECW